MKRWNMKRLAKGAVWMLAFFAFWVAVLEVILRLAGFGNVEIYLADPVLYWRLKPNQDCFTKIDRQPVHINAHGTRGAEFTVPKPAKVLRILALGDSRTFGWGLSEPASFAGLLEKKLQDFVGPSRTVEVINAGVNGYSYAQMHLFLRDHGVRFQPDLVLLGDGNLWTQFSDQNSPEFIRSFTRRVWIKNLLRRLAIYHYVVEYKLQALYERTRTRFVPIDPKTDTFFKEEQKKDPNAFYREYLTKSCHLANSNGIQPILAYVPTLDELKGTAVAHAYHAKTNVSRTLSIPLIEVTEDLRPHQDKVFLEGDPVHLNQDGNRIIAETLFRGLTNRVAALVR